MNWKLYSLLVLGYLTLHGVKAQQLPQFSQYMQNMYVLNPAASGTQADIDMNIGFRQQWTGFDGAPQTYYANGTINLGKPPQVIKNKYSLPISRRDLYSTTKTIRQNKHVVGGMVAADEYGLFNRTSFMVSYAFHLPIADKYWLAAGTSLGWYGLNFGHNNVILENEVDRIYNDFISNGTKTDLFDINGGLYFYGHRLFLGYSVFQLAQNNLDLGDISALSEAKLKRHHFATAGYRLSLAENLDLTPSIMFKILGPAPLSLDFNVKAQFYKKFWIGLSYRNEDAVSILAGIKVNNWMNVGYAYDYVTSKIGNLSSGSHELVAGFQLSRKKH